MSDYSICGGFNLRWVALLVTQSCDVSTALTILFINNSSITLFSIGYWSQIHRFHR